MDFNVKILSRETIKPFSPTPQCLRKYNLSYLDQMAPPTFIPHIYFYTSNTKFSNSEKSNDLKNSLSRVLTRFYPLAGRLVDNRYVDCNDEGSPYIEAEVDCDIFQVIKDPKPLDMNKFLPYQVEDIQNINMAVQVTFFECGSMAIGLMVSHVIADAQSSFSFAKSWADVTRLGDTTDIPCPKFEFASIFPPRVLPSVKPSLKDYSIKEELVTKLFKFSSSMISTLRDTYASFDIESTTPRPSRVAALSSFIFTRFASATELNPNQNKTFVVVLFANLRSRFEPPLSEDYFGNMSDGAAAMPNMGDGGQEIARKVTESVRTKNEEFMAKIKEREKHLNVAEDKVSVVIEGEVVVLSFSSFCSYPMYEQADFGWGEPSWVGSVPLPYKNLVTFIDSRDGIEAWIVLEKEDMKKFEADLELQAFLSLGFDGQKQCN